MGWTVARNLQIDARWAAADADLFRKYATELVASAPDVILASTSSAVAPLRQATRTGTLIYARQRVDIDCSTIGRLSGSRGIWNLLPACGQEPRCIFEAQLKDTAGPRKNMLSVNRIDIRDLRW